MKKYPRFVFSGLKAVIEDFIAVAQLAGKADDAGRAPLTRVPIETSARKGYVMPWRDGPLVISDGATGKVKVRPFWGLMSPSGAASGGGTEDAVASTETQEDLVSGFFSGQSIAVPTPLPGAGNVRWDLLYAIIGTADSDEAQRLIRNPISKLLAAKTVFTRTKPTVTLAWKLGLEEAAATDPYPSGSIAVLPSPITGQAHVPLAYVQVRNSGTPGTVTYGLDHIANDARLWRVQPKSGVAQGLILTGAGKATHSGALQTDPATLIATLRADGGWPTSGSNVRPARFIEATSGVIEAAILLGPFSTTVANKTFGSTFSGSPLIPLSSPDAASILRDNARIDWRNRVFKGELLAHQVSGKFGYDPTGDTTSGIMPSSYIGVTPEFTNGAGQSFRGSAGFDTLIGNSNYFLAGYFHDVAGYGANDDVAILVEKSTGALFMAARETTSNAINGAQMLLTLRAWDQFATA